MCAAVADAAEIAPHHVWATWHEIAESRYIEGDRSARVQPSATHPPIVRLISFEGKSDATIEKMLNAAALALVSALRLDDGNVFITYDEASSGRIHTGGRVLERDAYRRDPSTNAPS